SPRIQAHIRGHFLECSSLTSAHPRGLDLLPFAGTDPRQRSLPPKRRIEPPIKSMEGRLIGDGLCSPPTRPTRLLAAKPLASHDQMMGKQVQAISTTAQRSFPAGFTSCAEPLPETFGRQVFRII